MYLCTLAATDAGGIDPYELLDPEDILSKIPKDFYDNLVRCVCVCVCVCTDHIGCIGSVCMYIRMFIHTYIRMHVRMYIHTCVCMYVCTHVRTYVRLQ